MLPEPLAVTVKVTAVMEKLGVAYAVGGSLAATLYGEIRTTQDSDILADMHPQHVEPFAEALEGEFFVDPQMIAHAIAHKSRFNVVHRDSMFKVDVFIPEPSAFNTAEPKRARKQTLSTEPATAALFCTAEDTVLSKLLWFRMGGKTSERQWRDVLGILKVQAGQLDLTYLRRWAHELNVADLLEEALKES